MDILGQLPQLEALCERLFNSQARLPPDAGAAPYPHSGVTAVHKRLSIACMQDPLERGQAEQMLRVFGQSTDYVSHCKVRRRVQRPGLGNADASVAYDAYESRASKRPPGAGNPGQLDVGIRAAAGLREPHQGGHGAHAQVRRALV